MLSVQPSAFGPRRGTGSRPSSAKGRSAFAPGTSVTASADAVNNTRSAAKVESDLVSNLKEQISCLEMEVTYLKDKNSSLTEQLEQARSHQQQVPSTAGAPNTAEGLIGQQPGDFRLTHQDLLAHAQRLEKEVADLRSRFAEREKQHQLDLARIRAGAEPGGRDSHSNAIATGNVRQELAQARDTHSKDIAQLKEGHAQAIITLQKTIERVSVEQQTNQNELLATVRERDSLLRDLATHKDEIRTVRANLDTVSRQYSETQRMLGTEQEERRRLETREKDLRFQVGQGHQDVVAELNKRVQDLENRAKVASAEAALKQFEADQLKVQHQKLQQDMFSLVAEKGTMQEEIAQHKCAITDLNDKITKGQSAHADVTAERDYFRLQIDRLKVDHSVLDVKANQLEAKAEGDKTSYLNLERQYCTALETIDQLKRESKAKEKVYEQLDENDTKLRQSNLVLTQELQTMRHNADELKAALTDISAKYEANRGLADQARSEQQLAMTLTKLDKMKGELQNLLGTQLRLTQDLSGTMMDLPDSSAVMRAMSPAPTHQPANVSTVVIPQAPVSAPVSVPAPATTIPAAAVVPAPVAPATATPPQPAVNQSLNASAVSAADIKADISAIVGVGAAAPAPVAASPAPVPPVGGVQPLGTVPPAPVSAAAAPVTHTNIPTPSSTVVTETPKASTDVAGTPTNAPVPVPSS